VKFAGTGSPPAGRIGETARTPLHTRHEGRRGSRREHLRGAHGRDRRRGRDATTARYLPRLYGEAEAYARARGIIIADTKFEFGRDAEGRVLLIDEALTPDSSRFWPAESYAPGGAQASFDKQFVRDYLETLAWDKRPPAPPLPPDIAEATTARYLSAYRLLTGADI
jgi:phosphoribosylaminoimidazole-succinocarboxamide synthase